MDITPYKFLNLNPFKFKKVPLRFELRIGESESPVLTNYTMRPYELYTVGPTESRTRVGGFKVLSDDPLHYKTRNE